MPYRRAIGIKEPVLLFEFWIPFHFYRRAVSPISNNRPDSFDDKFRDRFPAPVERQIILLCDRGLYRDFVSHLHRSDFIKIPVFVTVFPNPFVKKALGLV